MSSQKWPYPTIVAHRGGGALAPENTLAAMAAGIRQGHKMVECDVKLSLDDQAFLLHDDTLDRTTDGWGVAGQLSWSDLQVRDAGNWFAARFRGEPLPLLSQVAELCIRHQIAINIEIKPTTGEEEHTGTRVAQEAKRLWQGQALPPLLSSFSCVALRAAQQAAPELPRALLLEDWEDDWSVWTDDLSCFSLHLHHRSLTEERVHHIKQHGLFIMAYTVNQPARARQLLAWGVDAICTDRIDKIPVDFSL